MDSFVFKPMDRENARVVSDWTYERPYDLYNTPMEARRQTVDYLTDHRNHYYLITNGQGELLAYCCFGKEGQVPGGDYDDDALDLGLGVRPDLTGQGQGGVFVQAVVDFAREQYAPRFLRVTIAEFNKRAQRVWQKAGFQFEQRFERHHDRMPFVVLTREA